MLVHRKTNHITNIKYIRWTNVLKTWLKNCGQFQNMQLMTLEGKKR